MGVCASSDSSKVFLDPQVFKKAKLVDKKQISHNVVRLRFALSHPDQKLGLPVGQHITLKAKDAAGKEVMRPYSPVSDDDLVGFVDFVMKVYPKGEMTQILNKLEPGAMMLLKGPRGEFEYETNKYKHIGMIAGGSGITPIFQVLLMVLKDPADKTTFSLIYSNTTEEDILLRKDLEAMAAQHPGRLKLFYTLSKPPHEGWAGGSGRVTKDVITQHLEPPGPGVIVVVCGPQPMCAAMKENLDGLGYSEEMQFEF